MRNSMRWISVVVLGSCLAARPAAAQIEKGDKSLALQSLAWFATGDESFTFGLGAIGFNYFQTRSFAWRVGAVVVAFEVGDASATVTGLTGGLEWNFGQQGAKTVPFIAVDVSQLIGENMNSTGIAPSAGWRTFISRSTSFDVVGAYSTNLTKDDSGSSGGLITARLGFSFYFGKDSRR